MVGKMKSIECGIHGPYPATLLDCPECADSRHEFDDTKSEPDVLERLKEGEPDIILILQGSPLVRVWADAIAEIERLESELGIEQEFKAQAIEERNTAQAQLRAITEAKPVGFQYRWNKDAHWSTGFYHDIEHYRRNPEYEVRRLLVAPKGDTE